MDPGAGRAAGLLATLRRLLGTFTEVLQTRVELLSVELEEEWERARQLIVTQLVALFFLGIGFVLLTMFAVIALWETHRLAVLGGFAIVYLAIGVIAVLVARYKLRTKPRLFAATLAELEKDRQQLTKRS